MIIVEGPDGSGKTTLINRIREAYPDLPLAPRVVSKETNALVDMKEWVSQNLTEGFQYKLYDRHRLISEFIYGPILRNKQHDGFTSADWVSESLYQFYKLKPIIIYCLPPLETVKSNLAGDESNRAVWDHIEGMYAAYLHRMSLDFILGADVIEYNYLRPTLQVDPLRELHYHINTAYERVYK